MNDDHKFVAFCGFISFIFIALSLYAMGGNSERKRLHDKCLESNSKMAYNEAVAKCKEFIK